MCCLHVHCAHERASYARTGEMITNAEQGGATAHSREIAMLHYMQTEYRVEALTFASRVSNSAETVDEFQGTYIF